jgi:hypothetical protein
VDRVGDLLDRIRGVVDRSAQISELAGLAALKLGNRVQALSPEDLAWLFGPVTQAVIAAQESAIISAAVGSERLKAVRLALAAADDALGYLNRTFDDRWDDAVPYIEALIAAAKARRQFGFKPSEIG